MGVLFELTKQTALLQLEVEALEGAVDRLIGLYDDLNQEFFSSEAAKDTRWRQLSGSVHPNHHVCFQNLSLIRSALTTLFTEASEGHRQPQAEPTSCIETRLWRPPPIFYLRFARIAVSKDLSSKFPRKMPTTVPSFTRTTAGMAITLKPLHPL